MILATERELSFPNRLGGNGRELHHSMGRNKAETISTGESQRWGVWRYTVLVHIKDPERKEMCVYERKK